MLRAAAKNRFERRAADLRERCASIIADMLFSLVRRRQSLFPALCRKRAGYALVCVLPGAWLALSVVFPLHGQAP